MIRGMGRTICVLVGLASPGVLLSCDRRSQLEDRGAESAALAPLIGVHSEEPLDALLRRDAGHVGVVVRERRVVVPAPFGARLLERFVHPGDEVRTGQPLARFDSESVDRAAAVALAAVTEAEAALRVAQVEAERAMGRFQRRQRRVELFAEEHLEELRAEIEVSRARLESAQAKLRAVSTAAEEARAEAEKAVLRAPMDGVVDGVYTSPGAYETDGAPVVAIEAGEWRVRFAAPPEVSVEFSAGTPITVIVEDEEPVRRS